jgi:hypothetical protein
MEDDHMKSENFCNNWLFKKEGESEFKNVTLPHDAMIHEKRQPDSEGGSGHGYFVGGKYIYEKHFNVPDEWKDKSVYVEFEGVYKNAEVFINSKSVAFRPYGYVPIVVCMDEYLNYGCENVISVIADNSKLPNSRWYSGSGIYRPVSLIIGNKKHIDYNGVKITTLSYNPAKINVKTKVSDNAKDLSAVVEIKYSGKVIAKGNGLDIEINIPNAMLWSDETPNLYECHVSLQDNGVIVDEVTQNFGIRMLEWSSKGFFVNGKATLLRGGCVHHDNGILGDATYDKSEFRRVAILKNMGFNAIRSAHNPASRAMLEACDKYGMYLMDETFDMWYNRKNKYDYGCDFDEWWESDTIAMVERDYNHPSVILYSIGNEVAEPHEEKGVNAGKAMIDLIHSIDFTRPVTCGVNMMIIGRAAKGNGIYQDGETNIEADKGKDSGKKKESQNASLAFNIMASFIGTGMNKGGNSKKVDSLVSPFADLLDIVGYNYGSGRYPLDGKEHPDRIIFGSETFPQDIYKNWEMVKKFPYLIGDFMWTSWDYLGEAGLGAWSYTGGMPFNRPYPWVLAGAGVIDILGIPDASCRYAQVVWEKNDKPIIAVKPVNHPKVRPSKSVWRGTNAIESWSWADCQGNAAEVEVYDRSDTVELFLNGKSLGKKKLKEYKAVFKLKYAPGILEAVAYNIKGNVTGRNKLDSATGKIKIKLIPEEEVITKGDIVYLPIEISGENGVVDSNSDCTIYLTVIGGTLLGFGSANPCTEEVYDSGTFTTYQGRALAVVRGDREGEITIKAQSKKFPEAVTKVTVK